MTVDRGLEVGVDGKVTGRVVCKSIEYAKRKMKIQTHFSSSLRENESIALLKCKELEKNKNKM